MTTLRLLLLFIFIINICSQNSSDCINMTLNKSTDQQCYNSTDCCYFEYVYNGKKFQKCLVKLNQIENICKNFSQVINTIGGMWITCSCFSMFYQNFIFMSLILVLII